MKITRRQIKSLISQGLNEQNEAEFSSSAELEQRVLDALTDAGGAADAQSVLDTIEDDLPPDTDAKDFVASLDTVETHPDGDLVKAVAESASPIKITSSEIRDLIREAQDDLIRESGHTDVPSARRAMMTSIEDATEILNILVAKDHGHHLPSWWMKKAVLAADYLSTARNFLVTDSVGDSPAIPEELSTSEPMGCPGCGMPDGDHTPDCPYSS